MRQRFERAAVFLVLIASPLWLARVPPSWSGQIRMTVVDWFKPALEGVQAVKMGLSNFCIGLLQGPALLEENRVLRKQIDALLAHEETHRQLFEENARLRNTIGFKAKAPWVVTPAEVIGRELGLWSRTLLLDKGTRNGIHVGMAVITPVGLVGRIMEGGSSSSRAILMTDPHFRVAATVSPSRVSGLLMGTASGESLLTYLPLDTEVKPGDVVLTSGGKSFSPEGIAIGMIRSVHIDPSELFRVAQIRPTVDLSAVEEVLVVSWSDSGE